MVVKNSKEKNGNVDYMISFFFAGMAKNADQCILRKKGKTVQNYMTSVAPRKIKFKLDLHIAGKKTNQDVN